VTQEEARTTKPGVMGGDTRCDNIEKAGSTRVPHRAGILQSPEEAEEGTAAAGSWSRG